MAIETIHVKELLRSGQSEVLIDEHYDLPELPVVGTADANLRVTVNTTGLIIKGRYQATVEEPCDRCFEPYERIISGRVDDRFVHGSLTDTSPGEHELHSDDFYDTIGPDGVVDIKDLIRQYIILGLTSDRVCNGDGCRLPIDSIEPDEP